MSSTLVDWVIEHRRVEYGRRDGSLLGTYPVRAATPRAAIAKLLKAYDGLVPGEEYLVARRGA